MKRIEIQYDPSNRVFCFHLFDDYSYRQFTIVRLDMRVVDMAKLLVAADDGIIRDVTPELEEVFYRLYSGIGV